MSEDTLFKYGDEVIVTDVKSACYGCIGVVQRQLKDSVEACVLVCIVSRQAYLWFKPEEITDVGTVLRAAMRQ